MSDKNADATQADADADDQSQADTTTKATQADADETISLDEAKKLRSENASLRKRAKDAEMKAQAAESAKQQREEAEAKEQGKWEELAKKYEGEIDTLKQQIATRDQADVKATIAKKHGIPDDLIPMLQGETEDDIDASAKTVAKHLKVRESTDIDAGVKTQNGERKKAETDKKAFADPARWGLRQR